MKKSETIFAQNRLKTNSEKNKCVFTTLLYNGAIEIF